MTLWNSDSKNLLSILFSNLTFLLTQIETFPRNNIALFVILLLLLLLLLRPVHVASRIICDQIRVIHFRLSFPCLLGTYYHSLYCYIKVFSIC
jgi:hypothetical protein